MKVIAKMCLKSHLQLHKVQLTQQLRRGIHNENTQIFEESPLQWSGGVLRPYIKYNII